MKNACKYYAIYTECGKSGMLPLRFLNYPEGVKTMGFNSHRAAVSFLHSIPKHNNLPGNFRNAKVVEHDKNHFTVSYEYTHSNCKPGEWFDWTRDYEIRKETFVLFDKRDTLKGFGLGTY